jgi:hypothetical protein
MKPGHRVEIPDQLSATDNDTLVIGVYKLAKRNGGNTFMRTNVITKNFSDFVLIITVINSC